MYRDFIQYQGSNIQYQSVSRNGRPYKKAKLAAEASVRGKMEFLKKRQITGFGESLEESGLAFLDLTYAHSNKVFHLLAREGLLKDDNSSQTLASFLEVVSFIHCWIEMMVKRRAPRQGLKDVDLMFSDIKTSWGVFFAAPPEGPGLENASIESVRDMMTRRCDQYHALYLSALETRGRLHALKACCAAFLENISSGYLIREENLGNDQERKDESGEAVLGYIREFVYDLERDIQVILAQHRE